MGIFGVPDSKTFVESWRTITESREIQMIQDSRIHGYYDVRVTAGKPLKWNKTSVLFYSFG